MHLPFMLAIGTLIRWLLLSVILAVGLCDTPKKPNILLLMSDQHRQDAIGAYGNSVVQTPNMDFIAARGIRFTKSYSTTPTCTPARAALLTGLGPWNHGLLGFGRIPPKYPYEMPDEFMKNGFRTVAIGKNHFGEWDAKKRSKLTHGYQDEELYDVLDAHDEEYFQWLNDLNVTLPPQTISGNDIRAEIFNAPTKYHPTAWTGERAVYHLDELARSESPFFMKVSFHRPHGPYDPPQEYWDLYEDVDADIPPPIEAGWEHQWNKTYGDPPCPGPNFGFDCWHGNFGRELPHKTRRAYYASVSFVDDQIGRILQKLHETGLDENTYVLYISDHGDQLGDHFLWRKGYPYEGSVRVPTLFMWPKNDSRFPDSFRGQSIDDMIIELRDFFPTVLQLAGIPERRKVDGVSWLSLFDDQVKDVLPKRQYIDLEHNVIYDLMIHWNALTDGKWKYIFWAYSAEEQLFDLENDPFETRSLHQDETFATTLSKWRNLMIDHLKPRGRGYIDGGGNLARREYAMPYSPNLPSFEIPT